MSSLPHLTVCPLEGWLISADSDKLLIASQLIPCNRNGVP